VKHVRETSWACFAHSLQEAPVADSAIQRLNTQQLILAYRQSERRLLLLDYDGTLTPMVNKPEDATPSPELIDALTRLHADPRNEIYIISGRDKAFFEQQPQLAQLPIGFSCEHGCFLRLHAKPGEPVPEWQNLASGMDLSWKKTVMDILDEYAERTPGARVEEKRITVSWHYRNADPQYGEHQKNMLMLHLQGLPKLPIDILVGKKVVEVRPQGFTKGTIARSILNSKDSDADRPPPVEFILCIGDDKTDEDMFEEVLKEKKGGASHKFTITIKKKASQAAFFVDSIKDVLDLLNKFQD